MKWNYIGGCYVNQKHSEMLFRTLANMPLLIFTILNHFAEPSKIRQECISEEKSTTRQDLS